MHFFKTSSKPLKRFNSLFAFRLAHDLSRGLMGQKNTRTISMVLSHHVTLGYTLKMKQTNFSRLIASLVVAITIAFIFSLNSIVTAQDTFVIGAFWAPAETAYYSQVRDCGMNLIQQPSISEGELIAAERYGFRYIASDSVDALYSSGQRSVYQAEQLFELVTGGYVNDDPGAHPRTGRNAVRAVAGTDAPGYLICNLDSSSNYEQNHWRRFHATFRLKMVGSGGSDQVATLYMVQ